MNLDLPFEIVVSKMNPRGMGRVEQYKIEVMLSNPVGYADSIFYKHRDGSWMLSPSSGLHRGGEGDLLCLIALAEKAEELARPKASIDFQI